MPQINPISKVRNPDLQQTQIKICGISNSESIDAAVQARADYIGLVHYEPSPRHVSLKQASDLRQYAGDRLKVVLLLVDSDVRATGEAIDAVGPDIVQFHGTETPGWLRLVREHFKIEIWKAIGLRERATLERSAKYQGVADRLLFDAPSQTLPGGTGTRFNWSLLSGHKHQIDWGLAGGLDANNVESALKATAAPLVDVSSGVESASGVKDLDRIKAFCQAVHDYEKC